ncbi:GNAT family N-acetyltransferase [Nocardioides marinquilinus]|uniref:[Ribosomal protein bS18]-alanine N-acetyltransferase n=1 Tax=Nocardioides marinquilinus TaxID=1210400 RepID=A0ABP9PHR6_9ACTN
MSDPVVRRATPDDADAVAALEAEALGRDAWSPGLVAAGVSGEVPTVTYLVAEVDGVLAGYAVGSVAGDLAELQRIAVGAGHRRRGLASVLLEALVDLARDGGADRLLLEVREDNHGAAAFYAARGFTEIDRRRRYYRDGATAVVLLREIA